MTSDNPRDHYRLVEQIKQEFEVFRRWLTNNRPDLFRDASYYRLEDAIASLDEAESREDIRRCAQEIMRIPPVPIERLVEGVVSRVLYDGPGNMCLNRIGKLAEQLTE